MPDTRYKVNHTYKRIQAFKYKMWSKGSPLVFEKGNLLVDITSGKTMLFAKFGNIANQTINDLFLDIQCYDKLNNLTGVLEGFRYSGLQAAQGDSFGDKTPAELPYGNINSVEIVVKKIVFESGEVWLNSLNNPLETIPKQQKLADVLRDDLYAQFEREYKSKYELESEYSLAEYSPAETEDYWLCTCGQFNLPANSLCCNCSCSKAFTFEYTKPSTLSRLLLQSYSEDKANEIQKSQRNKKLMMLSKIIAAAGIAVIVFLIINAKIIQPPIKYEDAKKVYNAGNYKQAASLFEQIPKYKDSGEMFVKTSLKIIASAKAGDIVRFGKFEQDNKKLNGKETIDWMVLLIKDNKALLISEKCLDYRAYDEYFNDAWETCTLRKWLNNDFLSKAFTVNEKKVIAATTLVYSDKTSDGKAGENVTQDKVFLLSNEEATMYFENDEARQAYNTDYVEAKMDYSYPTEGISYTWLLRSYGYIIDPSGTVYKEVYFASDIDEGVRPTIWVDLKIQS